jgi:hypothetical protein
VKSRFGRSRWRRRIHWGRIQYDGNRFNNRFGSRFRACAAFISSACLASLLTLLFPTRDNAAKVSGPSLRNLSTLWLCRWAV